LISCIEVSILFFTGTTSERKKKGRADVGVNTNMQKNLIDLNPNAGPKPKCRRFGRRPPPSSRKVVRTYRYAASISCADAGKTEDLGRINIHILGYAGCHEIHADVGSSSKYEFRR
jgi:hypothetical protein